MIACTGDAFAQDTLPNFTVKNNKGKVSVSWQNKYQKEIKSITIQSSFDSLKKFSSLKVVSVPNDFVNGFFDLDVPYEKMFYRLFIVFDSGAYIFTPSKRPEVDPKFDLQKNMARIREANKPKPESKPGVTTAVTASKPVSTQMVPKKNDIPVASAVKNPKTDSVKTIQTDEARPEPVKTEPVKTEVVVKKEPVPGISRIIYTGKDNNVVINLPDYNKNTYSVKFFDENKEHLFDLHKVNEGYLIIEKVNFLHAGWFFFDLYKNDQLLERNKFYIPKD
ncbi:MAG TPA: hypothetical protein VHL77_10330 [Ferruginibacter sp.]|nr:hypothetical protein [Ferruginibacter sp.]